MLFYSPVLLLERKLLLSKGLVHPRTSLFRRLKNKKGGRKPKGARERKSQKYRKPNCRRLIYLSASQPRNREQVTWSWTSSGPVTRWTGNKKTFSGFKFQKISGVLFHETDLKSSKNLNVPFVFDSTFSLTGSNV